MQAAQRVSSRPGVIVLNKNVADTVLRQLGLMIALEKESARILVHLGANEQYARNFRLLYLHVFSRTDALTP
jgi:hypothetical protein